MNIIFEQILGRYIICMFFYPYQNAITREQIDRSNNLKFGQEFAHFLDSFIYTLQNKKGDILDSEGGKSQSSESGIFNIEFKLQ